jgi:glycosyltransferase involved in cell wall biosynthesis
MKSPKSYYVVVPAFNEQSRIEQVLIALKKITPNIIVVNDGSSDSTSLVANKNKVLTLDHKINMGKGAAMKTGAEAAFKMGADYVIFLDADGQHDPKDLPKFIKKINDGFDIVFGSRNLSYGVPLIRFLGNKVGAFIISSFFGIYRRDLLCGFMAMTKEAYRKIIWDSLRYGVETEIVAKTGKNRLKYGEIPIETIYIDKYKGVTILDAIGILFNIPKWLLS